MILLAAVNFTVNLSVSELEAKSLRRCEQKTQTV